MDEDDLKNWALSKTLREVGHIDEVELNPKAYQNITNDLASQLKETGQNKNKDGEDTSTIIFNSNKKRTQNMNLRYSEKVKRFENLSKNSKDKLI